MTVLDWWALFHTSLWVVGLAVSLAAFSVSSDQAHREKVRLRQKLDQRAFQFPLNLGMSLFCLGLLFGSGSWWEKLLWAILATLFLAVAVWPRGQQDARPAGQTGEETAGQAGKTEGGATSQQRRASPLRGAARALAAVEIWPVALAVGASVVSARLLPWAVGLAGVFWLVRLVAHGRLTVRTPADWGVLLLLLMGLVSLWITASPDVTRLMVWRLLSGIALYYAIANWATTFARWRVLMGGIVAAGLFLAIYAPVGVQWISGKLPFIPSFLYNRVPLLTSDSVNPNVMAGSLVILLPCAFACLLFGWRQLSGFERVLTGVAALTMTGVLIGTQARGALAGLAAVLSALAMLRWRRGWLLLLALAIAGAVVVWLLGAPAVLNMLMVSGTVASLESRLEVWSRAVFMIQDFPFTGVGMGSFGQVADLLYPFFLAGPGTISHVHNLFLQVAVDLGLPGLVAWLAILIVAFAMAWQLVRIARQRADGWMAGVGAGLLCSQVALVVHGLTDSTTWGEIRTAPLVWALWGGIMASVVQTSGQPSEDMDRSSSPQPKAVRPAAAPGAPRSTRWLGWGLVLAGLLMLAGWGAVTGVQLVQHARSLRSHLDSVEGLAQSGASALGLAELETVGQHLSGMHQDLEAIRSAVGPLLPAGRLLRWVPKHGGDLAAASDLLQLATAVVAAGDRTFQALAPTLEMLSGSEATAGSAPGVGERLLPVLAAAQPDLRRTQQELAAAAQARERIDLQSLSPQVAGLLAKLDRYLPWFGTAVDGAVLAPSLLGAGGPRTYLIVAQNNQELRPTGGFISGVGELRIEEGRLDPPRFRDSYAVDNLEVPHQLTPPDLRRTMSASLWLFRDTNWDADFPTSARRALEVYAQDRGVRADGVITLDLPALQLLVDAVGPLPVEGIAEPVTGQNVLPVIQAQWGEGTGGGDPEWWLHRKDFMGQIAKAAMERLTSPKAGQDLQPVKLAQALKRALDEKHILIYLADPQAAGLLRERNWDGAAVAPPSPSDALLVVDSNVGFNKVDANVVRSIYYQVDLMDREGPRARLTLTYRNLSRRPVGDCIQEAHYGDTYADMIERCYWDYVRVYVPAGSRLLVGPDLSLPTGSLLARSGEAVPQPPISPTLTAGDWEVWAAFFALEPLAERTLTFDYRLPVEVLDAQPGPDGLMRYRLWVQKQPGTEAVPLQVEILLPPGTRVVRAVPADLPATSTDLRTDREFEIAFREAGEGP